MIALYLLALFALGIYSYSQIDLNLTLFQNSTFLAFQNVMIQLGYFNRSLSTIIFVSLVLILFLLAWRLSESNQFSWWWVAVVGAVGLLSYPAFSHDIFNYLFDAKILTFYHQNPYFFKALDFPSDPWLRFMHWTHRTYPYGPFWLLATAPLSFLGFGKFVLTLFNFKLFFVGVYLANVALVKKIAPKAAIFFALNPLVVIESVISPHLDAFMTLFLLLAILFFDHKLKAWLFLIVSVAVKFLTGLLAPLFFFHRFKPGWAAVLLLAASGFIIWQRGPYPWYLLPVVAILCLSKFPSFSLWISLGAVLTYAPYLAIGSYPSEVLTWQYLLFVFPILVLPARRFIH